MKHYTYDTVNTCSRKIEFDLTDDLKITNLVFTGGCSGNLIGIKHLIELVCLQKELLQVKN